MGDRPVYGSRQRMMTTKQRFLLDGYWEFTYHLAEPCDGYECHPSLLHHPRMDQTALRESRCKLPAIIAS